MDLLIGLAVVDQVTGGKQMRQLSHGWMGWESRSGRWLRARSARALIALAARLAPANPPALPTTQLATGAPQP